MKIGNKLETIYLDDYLKDGILIEKYFREKVNSIDWEIYQSKKVLIKGCASAPIPTWAYMILTAKLTKYANYISYGEPCSSFEIYKKLVK